METWQGLQSLLKVDHRVFAVMKAFEETVYSHSCLWREELQSLVHCRMWVSMNSKTMIYHCQIYSRQDLLTQCWVHQLHQVWARWRHLDSIEERWCFLSPEYCSYFYKIQRLKSINSSFKSGLKMMDWHVDTCCSKYRSVLHFWFHYILLLGTAWSSLLSNTS